MLRGSAPPYQERSASQLILTQENETTSVVSEDGSSVSEHSCILTSWSEESDWSSAAIFSHFVHLQINFRDSNF